MNNIFNSINQSIRSNWAEIVVGIALLIILLLTLSMYGMTFEDINGRNKKKKPAKTVEIVYEGMSNKLCEQDDLEKMCSNMGKGKRSGCNSVNCCVWVKNEHNQSCVEGDENGPVIREDEQNNKYDEYYYMNKKFKMEN